MAWNPKQYDGICAHCFSPIAAGEGVVFRDGGRKFHSKCAERNSYYVKLEKRLSKHKERRFGGAT